MCSTVCLDRILKEVEHVTINNAYDNSIREAWNTNFLTVIIHVIFVFLKNILVFISFVRHHFYFYIIFVLKINIVFVFVNDGQSISVFVIITELSLTARWTNWVRETFTGSTTPPTVDDGPYSAKNFVTPTWEYNVWLGVTEFLAEPN